MVIPVFRFLVILKEVIWETNYPMCITRISQNVGDLWNYGVFDLSRQSQQHFNFKMYVLTSSLV